MEPGQKAVVVGISGCSSSGKTTLARLLRDIFPNTFILHQDDFYKLENQLPVRHGLADWDCPEAISIGDMELALAHIRSTGTFPPAVESIEDQNSVGVCPIAPARLDAAKARVRQWLQPGQPGYRIFPHPELSSIVAEGLAALTQTAVTPPTPPLRLCLLDGFLLYATPHFRSVMASLDIKLFLLVSRAKATKRREARDGYVTSEGFWQDPPGYMDKIVWPNYAAAHAWMFEDGDAETGRLRRDLLAQEGILAQTDKGLDVDFGETLDWAVDTIMKELEAIVLSSNT